eukprot:Lithocolla_globosa_v1_NODE_3511_length_1651_cov_16.684211.p2 type:complete len:141 gc:universal NODE_3511_length_1651_cov_16.684211:542-120(-)
MTRHGLLTSVTLVKMGDGLPENQNVDDSGLTFFRRLVGIDYLFFGCDQQSGVSVLQLKNQLINSINWIRCGHKDTQVTASKDSNRVFKVVLGIDGYGVACLQSFLFQSRRKSQNIFFQLSMSPCFTSYAIYDGGFRSWKV